jgi:hypothetical protein
MPRLRTTVFFTCAALLLITRPAQSEELVVGMSAFFGLNKHQGLDEVYFTTVEEGHFVPLTDWGKWRP